MMIKVLFVDDEPFILNGLEVLVDWNKEGFKVIGKCLESGAAFDMIQEQQPDLVISDIKMPEMSGIELLKKVRGELNLCTYFIMLSGFSDFEYVRSAFKNDCIDYLLKPVNKKELLKALEKVKALYKEKEGSSEQELPDGVLSSVQEDMNENFSENLTLKGMGEKYYVNSAYLGQLFKKQFGESFKDRLNRLRIEKAAELLLTTDKRVYEICGEIGYKDVDYFINKFICIKGVTPAKYRKLNSK